MKYILLGLLFASATLAQTVEQIVDINPSFASSNPGRMVKFGDKVLFFATTEQQGSEPWISDGTPAGTFMLKDIFPGTIGSSSAIFSATPFFVLGTEALFKARDDTRGWELWKTDGTPAGTVLVKDINSGSASSNIRSFVEYQGRAYFSADDGQTGDEPWFTDGSTAGTQLLRDIDERTILGGGGVDSSPSGFYEYDGRLYFSASRKPEGFEPWVTDGTTIGTVLFKNLNTMMPFSSEVGSNPHSFTAFNGQLYFIANLGYNATGVDFDAQIFVSDGTPQGTGPLIDIRLEPDSQLLDRTFGFAFFVLGNQMLFAGNDGTGIELWRTDGTVPGTTKLKEINPSITGGSFPNRFFQSGQNQALFLADDGTGIEIYRTDGTTEGTGLLREINPTGFNDGDSVLLDSTRFVQIGGLFYFAANDPLVSGREIWMTDSTTGGTRLVADFNPQGDLVLPDLSAALTPIGNDGFVFAGEIVDPAGLTDGVELYRFQTPLLWISGFE